MLVFRKNKLDLYTVTLKYTYRQHITNTFKIRTEQNISVLIYVSS